MKISGILFDKDGTLFDFEATWLAVTEGIIASLAPNAEGAAEMARLAGLDLDKRRFSPGSPVVAGATRDVARLWAPFRPDLGVTGIERLANRAAIAASNDPGTLVPAVPDLDPFLADLARRGLALGIATHDSAEAAETQLAITGARRHVRFVAGYDSGYRPKPAPDMLHAFALETGIAPAEVMMVGDSRHDLEMVRRAGAALAVGVLTGPATEPDLAPFADHVLPSIGELPALLERLGAIPA